MLLIKTNQEMLAALDEARARLVADPQTAADWHAVWSPLGQAARYAKDKWDKMRPEGPPRKHTKKGK
jgi:hypothetical protein